MIPPSKFLLDTCTYLWITTDPKKVPLKIRHLFQEETSELYLSAASIWELGIKDDTAGLIFHNSLEDFVEATTNSYGIDILHISVAASAQLKKLPKIHRDPFDRMIIAQAITEGLTIVTPDEHIMNYPVKVLWK